MQHQDYDVLCVGSGGAGVTAAVYARAQGARVALVSKDPIGHGNTKIAVGAISHPGLASGDSSRVYAEDLLNGAEGLADPRLVHVLAEEAPQATFIYEGYGHLLDRDDDGALSVKAATRLGGHRYPRSLKTLTRGAPWSYSLRAAVARAGIDVFEETMLWRLLLSDGRVVGALGWRLIEGQPVLFRARTVVLATGGYACVWPQDEHGGGTMRSITGDGIALALLAGAEAIDMELWQCIAIEPSRIGPHARLIDAEGHVIREGLHTMTRSELTRTVAEENRKRTARVKIDPTPNWDYPDGRSAWEQQRDAGGLELLRKRYGARVARWAEPFEAAPHPSYTIGGIRTDTWGSTRVPGLYAAGECTGGRFGANRLGSSSLVDITVFGKRAGEAATRWALEQSPGPMPQAEAEAQAASLEALYGGQGTHRPIQLVRHLQALMWDKVGLDRDEHSCLAAQEALQELRGQATDLRIAPTRRYNTEVRDAMELDLLLTAATAVAKGAQERRESRGTHFRLDYPQRSPQDENSILWLEDGVMRARREPVPSLGETDG